MGILLVQTKKKKIGKEWSEVKWIKYVDICVMYCEINNLCIVFPKEGLNWVPMYL